MNSIATRWVNVVTMTAFFLFAYMGVALAQEGEGGFLMGFREPLLELAGILIAAFLAWLTTWLRTTFKLQVEEKHRQALQTALENAAAAVINSALKGRAPQASDMRNLGVEVGSTAINVGLDYVKQSVPDAIKQFGLNDYMIDKLLRPHIVKLGAKLIAGK